MIVASIRFASFVRIMSCAKKGVKIVAFSSINNILFIVYLLLRLFSTDFDNRGYRTCGQIFGCS